MLVRPSFAARFGSLVAVCLVSCLPGNALGATAGLSTVPIQGVSVTGNGPDMLWYDPAQVARATRQVQGWLAHATEVPAPAMPKKQPVLMDYLGPARLYFTDGVNGQPVTVFPAYYLADAGKGGGVAIHYIPDIVTYRMGRAGPAVYLRAPALDRFLRQERLWQSQFVPEAFTSAETVAVRAVRRSRWGSVAQEFPQAPGERTATVRVGSQTLYETRTTLVQTEGASRIVTFEATWENGDVLEAWTFAVSSKGVVDPVGQTAQCLSGSSSQGECPLDNASNVSGTGLPS